MVLSPSKRDALLQKGKVNGSQPKDKQTALCGRSGMMSTPVPAMYRPTGIRRMDHLLDYHTSSISTVPASKAVSGEGKTCKKSSRADNRAALARVKALKVQLRSSTLDLDSVRMELDAVEKMLH